MLKGKISSSLLWEISMSAQKNTKNIIDIMETINANNHNIDFYTSDHLAVYVSFINNNIFNKKSFARNKQQKIRKRIFNYDKMNEEKWLKFQEATNLLPDIMEINCQQDLSSAWITFRS